MEKDIEKLIADNVKFVHYIINHYFPNLADDDDIYQLGLIGLWKACVLFDESKGTKLLTYASRIIINTIRMELRSRNTQKRKAELVSLDEPLHTDDHGDTLCVADTIADPKNLYDEVYYDIKDLEGLLSETEYLVVRLSLEGYSGAEISRMYNHSRIWATRILKRVRGKISAHFGLEISE